MYSVILNKNCVHVCHLAAFTISHTQIYEVSSWFTQDRLMVIFLVEGLI